MLYIPAIIGEGVKDIHKFRSAPFQKVPQSVHSYLEKAHEARSSWLLPFLQSGLFATDSERQNLSAKPWT